MAFSLDFDDTTSGESLFDQIDRILPIRGSGNPNGVYAAYGPGIYFFDETNGAEYRSATGNGTIPGTTWSVVINTIVPATQSQLGVVQFATPEEVADGVDDAKAVTPFSMANAFATLDALQTETNTRISADNAITSILSGHTTTLGNAASIATPNVLMKRDASGRAKVADGAATDDIATKGQMDAADATLQSQITTSTTDLANASETVANNKLIRRGSGGKAQVNPGASGNEIVVFSQLDAVSTVANAAKSVTDAATDANTNSTVVKRDGTGKAQVTAGASGNEIVVYSQLSTTNTNITNLTNLVAKMIGANGQAGLTLTSGANGSATPATAWVTLDTFGGAGTQNCTDLPTTNGVQFVLVQLANAAHIVTLKHGTGNLVNKDGKDIVFSNTTQAVLYGLSSTSYFEVAKFGFENQTITSQTTDFTAAYNSFNKVSTAGGNINATLPTAVGHAGAVIEIFVDNATNLTSILYTSGQNANGTTGQTISTANTGYKFISDGANWRLSVLSPSAGGGAGFARSNKSGNFNIATGDNGYVCSAALTATLPSIAGAGNTRVQLVLTGRFNVTLARNGANINGVASDMVLRGPCSLTLIEDGTSWWIAQ